MERGKFLASLALRPKDACKRSTQKTKPQEKKKCYPQYVDLFDKGEWEKLDQILRSTTLPTKENEPLPSFDTNTTEENSKTSTPATNKKPMILSISPTGELILENLNEEPLSFGKELHPNVDSNSTVEHSRTNTPANKPKLMTYSISPTGELIPEENEEPLSSRKELLPFFENIVTEVENIEDHSVRQPLCDITNQERKKHMDALDMAPLGDFLSPTDEFDITFLPQVQTNSSPEMEGILVMGQEQNSNADSNLQLTPSKRPCSTDCLTMPCDDVSLPPIKRKKRCDRRNCCFYCNCVLTNLTRHMVRQHPEEIEVARYIALLEVAPVETKIERQKIMESLRLRGNHVHNSSMINQPHSDYTEVLPIKRPPTLKEKSLSSYVSCKMCQGLFIRKTFFRHAQFCQGKSGIDPSLEEHEANELKDLRKKSLPSYIKVYGVSTCPKPNNVHSIMTETIMPRLWKDEIGQAAIKDRLILSTCNDFLKSHLDPKDHNQVARKMRDGSKLLLTIKEKDCAIKDFCDCFEPSKINIVIEAVRDLCGCEENGNVSVVGMPARLAWIIHECGKRLIDDTLCSSSLNKEEKEDIKQSVSDFLDLIKRRWQYEISTNAENSRKRKK